MKMREPDVEEALQAHLAYNRSVRIVFLHPSHHKLHAVH